MAHAPSLPSGLALTLTGPGSVYEDLLALRLGRTAPALTELLSILEANLNPLLTEMGFGAADLMQKYYWAGEVVTTFPALVVSTAVDTVEQNMGHTDTLTVQVTVAWGASIDRLALQKCFDTVNIVRGILYAPLVRSNYYDQQGRKLWTQLVPTGTRMLSPGGADWNNYFGMIAQFTMLQMPGMGNDLWLDRAPTP